VAIHFLSACLSSTKDKSSCAAGFAASRRTRAFPNWAPARTRHRTVPASRHWSESDANRTGGTRTSASCWNVLLVAAVSRCCCKSKIKKPGICSGLTGQLPDAAPRSRLPRETTILPTWAPVRLPRSLITAGLCEICTRPILSEIFAISHFLFLRF